MGTWTIAILLGKIVRVSDHMQDCARTTIRGRPSGIWAQGLYAMSGVIHCGA